MKIYPERLRRLRESMKYSQTAFAEIFGMGQSSIARYEKGEAVPSYELMIKIADYFDVSLDYIFGRTDNPQGKLYEYNPKNGYPADMANFVEMCFDPSSPLNAKLKRTLVEMLEVESEK